MRSAPRLARGSSLLIVALAGLAIAVPPARAALRLVPQDHATIQAAIDASVSGDSIGVSPGTYVESLTLAGKNVALYAVASAPVVTTNQTARVLDIGAGVTAATIITGLNFVDGMALLGGGIRCAAGASPRIRRCVFERNRVYLDGGYSYGGAIFLDAGSNVLIEDCTFSRNTAAAFPNGVAGYGGAIHCASGAALTVRRTLFYHNISQGLEGGPGGAIASLLASMTVANCTFEGNAGLDGGAIYANGPLDVRDCTFRSNSSSYGASAISSYDQSGFTLQLHRSVFHDNWALNGATVFVSGGGEINRCTLAFNHHPSNGAAIWFDGGFFVNRNIVSNNEGYGVEGNSNESLLCNDVWGNLGANYGPMCGEPDEIALNISEDPLFCDPANRIFTLQDASPCAPDDGFCGLRGARDIGCTVDVPEPPTSPERIAFLAPVTPNPARDRIDLRLELPQATHARLTIVDPAGRRCATIADGPFAAGRHELTWRAAVRMPPGVYWAVLDAGTRHARRFVILP